jgi:hypothetical protein
METLAKPVWCPASDLRLPSCLVDESTRLGSCHCCKRQVPVFQDDEGHWVFNLHTMQPDSRPAVEVLPPLR